MLRAFTFVVAALAVRVSGQNRTNHDVLRFAYSPAVMYTFRQEDCLNGGTYRDETGVGPSVGTAANCISRSTSSNFVTYEFPAAVQGVDVTSTSLKSGVITGIPSPDAAAGLSIEAWFTQAALQEEGVTNTIYALSDNVEATLTTGLNYTAFAYVTRTGADSAVQFYVRVFDAEGVPDLNSCTLSSTAFGGSWPLDQVEAKIMTVLSIKLEPGGTSNVTCYVATAGSAPLAATGQVPSVASTYLSDAPAVYIGEFDATLLNGDPGSALQGTIHSFIVYPMFFPNDTVPTLFAAAPPESLPFAINGTVETNATLYLNTPDNVYDAEHFIGTEDNPPATLGGVVILTLPANGNLYYNDTPVTHGGFVASNLSLLTYTTNLTAPGAFWARSKVSCAGGLDSFTFYPFGYCGLGCSVAIPVTAGLCVVDTQVLPYMNDTTFAANPGRSATFTLPMYDANNGKLGVVDGNESPYGTTYDGYVQIADTQGLLRDCFDDQPIENGQERQIFLLDVCFLSEEQGVFDFDVRFSDSQLVYGPYATFTVVVTFQYECARECTARGTRDNGSFPLNISVTSDVEAYTTLTQFPAHGTLFSGGDPAFLVEFFDLSYVPDPGYFNLIRYADNTTAIKNRNGLGINGCGTTVPCRCQEVASACPDEFTFEVSDGLASATVTFKVFVLSTPTNFTVSSAVTGNRLNVTIHDGDDDAYLYTVTVETGQAGTSVSVPIVELTGSSVQLNAILSGLYILASPVSLFIEKEEGGYFQRVTASAAPTAPPAPVPPPSSPSGSPAEISVSPTLIFVLSVVWFLL